MGEIIALRKNTERQYIPVTETAKFLRTVLKEAFPGIKFSVKTDKYSGGSSIDIRWTDGPTVAQVKTFVDVFEGSYFDSMIDYKGCQYAMLDGQPVRFGGDFIFENRDYSESAILEAIKTVWAESRTILPPPSAEDYLMGRLFSVAIKEAVNNDYHANLAQTLVYRELSAKTLYPGAPHKSATCQRVRSAGDDGYSACCGTK